MAQPRIKRTAVANPFDTATVFSWVGEISAMNRNWSGRSDQSDSDADQKHAEPAGERNVFAQDVLRSEGADNVAQGRSGNDEADRLPGKQNQQRVERQGHQRNSQPEPAVANGPAQENEQFPGPKAGGLARALHAVGNGNLTAGTAANKNRKQGEGGGHIATSSGSGSGSGSGTGGGKDIFSVVRGLVCPTQRTPTQMRTTPVQRPKVTCSCRKTTARRVRKA